MPAASVDTFFANLSLQWVGDLVATINQFHGLLRAQGCLVLCAFAGNEIKATKLLRKIIRSAADVADLDRQALEFVMLPNDL